jgi:phage gp29-like protein
MLAYLDSAIRCLALGSNLPTAATTGGSLALAQVQENTTEALIAFDRLLLAETINRDLIGAILRYNAPQIRAAGLGSARAPKFTIRAEKQENPGINAPVAAAALGAGIPLRKDEVYAKLGYTVPGPADDVIAPRQATTAAEQVRQFAATREPIK